MDRLKSHNRLEVTAKAPTIPFRETITQGAEGHCQQYAITLSHTRSRRSDRWRATLKESCCSTSRSTFAMESWKS